MAINSTGFYNTHYTRQNRKQSYGNQKIWKSTHFLATATHLQKWADVLITTGHRRTSRESIWCHYIWIQNFTRGCCYPPRPYQGSSLVCCRHALAMASNTYVLTKQHSDSKFTAVTKLLGWVIPVLSTQVLRPICYADDMRPHWLRLHRSLLR